MSSQKGFSLVEVIIVIIVLMILATVSFMAFGSSRKYAADNQAKALIDFFDEARQKALNQRKTFRVEINKTKRELRLIDEGTDVSPTASDDKIIKTARIANQVMIGSAPTNVSGAPTASSPIPVPSYLTSSYPLSSGDEKITLRFRRNGQVVDTGSDNIGTGSLMRGATIYVYSTTPSLTNPDVIRATTVLGTTGDTSLFRCTFVAGQCTNWKK